MAARCYPAQALDLSCHQEYCGPRQCVKGDPKNTVPVPFHQVFQNTTHSVLRVQGPVPPISGPIHVNIFNGSSGTTIPLKLRSTDTIMQLQQNLLKMRPELVGSVDLAYNGKPVQLHQTLAELQVKPGATFITYQKCHGG